jgi:RNA-directed DNA polymerase
MNRIGQTIRDKRVLGLTGRYLRAGVMVEGLKQASEEGTPQGGLLSPLLRRHGFWMPSDLAATV